MIVLDASLVVAWLAMEELPAPRHEIYRSLPDHLLLVPSHWPFEVSNALRSRMKARMLSIGDFHSIMERLDQLSIEIQTPPDLDEIGPLAQFALTHDLTTYDAAYVQLAYQRGVPLATHDGAMRTSAAKLNIPLLPA